MDKNVITVVINAISCTYADNLKDNPGTAEDVPKPILTDITGQAAETIGSHAHNDPQAARKEDLHPTTKTAFITVQLRYCSRKTSTPYKSSHMKQMMSIQYSLMMTLLTLTTIQLPSFTLAHMLTKNVIQI